MTGVAADVVVARPDALEASASLPPRARRDRRRRETRLGPGDAAGEMASSLVA